MNVVSRRRITLGADKAYDVFAFVETLKERSVTPDVAINGTVSRHGVARKTVVLRLRTTRASPVDCKTVRRRMINPLNQALSCSKFIEVEYGKNAPRLVCRPVRRADWQFSTAR